MDDGKQCAIDLLRLIGGDVAAVNVLRKSVNESHGDHFSAAIEFEQSILGTFVAYWNSGGGFSMKIYGEGVTAELSPLEGGFVRYDTGRRIKLKPDLADTHFKIGFYTQNATFLQSVCDHIAPSFPASDLRDNLKTMKLIESFQADTTFQVILGR